MFLFLGDFKVKKLSKSILIFLHFLVKCYLSVSSSIKTLRGNTQRSRKFITLKYLNNRQ